MTDRTMASRYGFDHINMPLFLITGGFIALFCLVAVIDLGSLSVILRLRGDGVGDFID